MKRILLSALLLFSLVIPVGAKSTAAPSIEALRDANGRIHCTAFSINEKQHLWMTAHHCVVVETIDGAQWRLPYIGWEQTTLYQDFPTLDAAIIQTQKASAPALELAGVPHSFLEKVHIKSTQGPEVGDYICVLGHGWGFENMTFFQGKLAVMSVDMGEWGQKMIFDMTAFPGHSGSPVMDKDGRVVSILQLGLQGGAATAGVRWFDLVAATAPFWQS